MGKKEACTDIWVSKLLEKAGIKYDPQGSSIKEIDEALKTASKNGKGNIGFPEFVGVSKDFVIVVEDKPGLSMHECMDDDGILVDNENARVNYAINGAIWYGQHIAKNTSYRKVIAVGVSGDEKIHRITPIYCDETPTYIVLSDVESFIPFNETNIEDYYRQYILGENTDVEKETAEILKDASVLHEALRNYGQLQTKDKPIVVSGILLALRGIEAHYFNIDALTGDKRKTDGIKIYDAIKDVLDASEIAPPSKTKKLLNQFSIIKDTTVLNEINPSLGKTPLKYYTEFLYEHIYKAIKYTSSAEDYIGRFYGEFMHYGGGDGQTLGIVLTPKHITQLFTELLDIKKEDVILDPCVGTAGFLIAGMHKEFNEVIAEKGLKSRAEISKDEDILDIRMKHLHGFEIQPYMFTIATTNMILRGDGKSNLRNDDFLAQDPSELKKTIRATVGMMNPPYSQGGKNTPNLYEINFINHLLDSVLPGGRVAVIVPVSTMTGKSNHEKAVKATILKNHTLEGVITLNPNTFYPVGTNPVVAVFTAGRPHPASKLCKFIDFKDDGYKLYAHIGLLETDSAKDKKEHLLDVWNDRINDDTKFCVKSAVTAQDEWLHSFFYFNDEIPTDTDFEKAISDYMSFQFSMIMQGRKYLFEGGDKNA